MIGLYIIEAGLGSLAIATVVVVSLRRKPKYTPFGKYADSYGRQIVNRKPVGPEPQSHSNPEVDAQKEHEAALKEPVTLVAEEPL
jgi:hypothetical protein